MAVTRSWAPREGLSAEALKPPVPPERRRELVLLLCSSMLAGCSLAVAYRAKTHDFPAADAALNRGELLNLNAPPAAGQMERFLAWVPEPDRSAAAESLASFLARARPLANVGALARARIPAIRVARLKPLAVVRTPAQYRRQFLMWAAICFAAFYAVHFLWRWRRFRGDGFILPAIHLLTGFGLTLAVSIRDPLRDTFEFGKFAWGVAAGCCLLALPLLRVFDWRRYARQIYAPLLAALCLFVLLWRFGSGPTGSDAKVNLGPFQPVECIKVLLVLFLAAYFARRWEWLRELHERRLMPRWLRWIEVPRFAHALPVMCAVGVALLMFFLLKDLGPALVTGFLFLILFAVARARSGLALLGLAILIGGVTIGYRLGKPKTVADRVSMWLSPWDNDVRGGDQLAHALWAFSTGGPLGSGPGYGDTGMIPAGHTDLVLPAIGEEWGFCGVAAVAALFFFLVSRCLVAAARAPDDHSMFLALGCGLLVALEMLLISGGALGAIPLSGVASPFISAGNSSMLANFFLFAIVLAISARGRPDKKREAFIRPLRYGSLVLAFAGTALLARAAYLQTVVDRNLLARDTLVYQEDGVKRPQHNPRLNSLAHELTRGNIYDRNGVLLATSRWDELQQHRADYEKLGVSIQTACSPLDSRQYPFGAATAHLLGDLRTGEKFHATNSSLVEHDQNVKLQGFKDYSELASYVRYRHHPNNGDLQRLRARDRNVTTSIDIRLQLEAGRILRSHLEKLHRDHGAALIMDAASGDLLALVSAPSPSSQPTPDELLDRARYGQYPPGSTFKLVTALAALRLDPQLESKRFHCQPLGQGRVGAVIPGWRKPIRDDIGDAAHGVLDMSRAITVSCNAYFAQLGVFSVGAKALKDTADQLEIPVGNLSDLKATLPFAAYGQGPVVITPFKMARVIATIASAGQMPQGRWILDDSNPRIQPPSRIIAADRAEFVASAMRSVVLDGTARRAMKGLDISAAGKTGTAQVDTGPPHSWFAGFAPYDAGDGRRIAFAVIVEHGGYGAQAAAPVARELIEAAERLGIIRDRR